MMIKPKLLVFAILFLVLILTPVGLNQYYQYQLQAPAKEEKDIIFIIDPGESVTAIAKNLKEANLIKNAFAFRLLVTQMGIGKNIQAGDFRLSPHMSSKEIAELLTHGAIDIWVTLPEGLRKEEQADKIEAKLKFGANKDYHFDKKEFIKLAEEGYMYPDTYLIAKDAYAKDVVARLKQTFDEKTAQIIKAKTNKDLTDEEVIVLASLIEREAKTNQEKPVIAGILMNRLNNGIALQVDATVQYSKGYDSANNSWWPQVTVDDYRNVRSPYNTYLSPGLPPTPISNPGLEAIRAATEPADTSYLYYLHDKSGKIHYAETIDEHNKNIKEHL